MSEQDQYCGMDAAASSEPTAAASSAPTSRSADQQSAPVTAAPSRRTSRRAADMADKMRHRAPRFHSHSAASVAYRCHQLHGESPQTWEQRISGSHSDFRRVALMIGTMRMLGASDLLTEKMMPIELALGPEGLVPLPDALHLAELADCREQEADESFRYKLAHGTATVADADEYLRRSAEQGARADVARREVERWRMDHQRSAE